MNKKHGLRKHKLYEVWTNIKTRCSNPNTHNYKNYGGRGIKVCKEWRYDFQSFFDFCIKNGWNEKLQIDRIDNGKSYSPDNCRFVTNRENSLNRVKLRSDNKTGYVGVYYKKDRRKFYSSININQRLKHLGYFETATEAAVAHDLFIIKENLDYNLNFKREELNVKS